MNTSAHPNAILIELNREKVEDLIPVYVILGFLMVFGLTGNTLVLIFIWRKARRDIASFFILVLALTDSLVCLTISLVILELSKIYIFTFETLCRLYVFSKFFTALFSGFVLLTIAVYRYRKICCPLKGQLTLKGARITSVALIFLVLVLSFPQMLFVETESLEIPNKYNVTVFGSECTLKAVDNDELTTFQTALDGIYVLIFVTSSTALIILYCFQARAILRLKRNLTKFKLTKDQSNTSQSTSGHSEAICNNSLESPTEGDSHGTKQLSTSVRDHGSEGSVSSTKITIMFFVIALGFILSFMPYLAYSLWRTFTATASEIVFQGISPLNLFCLNSYLINSVINPVVYGIFHMEFRQFLKRLLCC